MNKHKESVSNGNIGEFKVFKIQLHIDNTGYTTRDMHSFLTERESSMRIKKTRTLFTKYLRLNLHVNDALQEQFDFRFSKVFCCY